MTWKGIVGQRFTVDEFDAYVAALDFSDWRPEFVVVHNTLVPTLAQWHSSLDDIEAQQRWFRNTLKWSAGPHLYVDPEGIWVFTPLTKTGVHSPSWNGVALGMEIVGDFDREVFKVMQRYNVIRALAAIHLKLGWLVPSIKLHKEDPATTHTGCPGKNVVKADLEAAVNQYLSIPR